MIEKILLDHLNNELDVPVFMERPHDPPESYCLLERTGGSIESHIVASGTFAIQSYASSLYDACELNEKVLDVVVRILPLDELINYVGVDGYYNFTDNSTKDYRYQTVINVGYYFMEGLANG